MADTYSSTDMTPNHREAIWAYDPVLKNTFKVKGTSVNGAINVNATITGGTAPITVDIADTLNNPISAFPATFLRVTDEPHQVFYDPFDSTLDVTNRWTSTQGSSGVAASNALGVMSMGTGVVANGYSKLASQPSFTLPIPAWLGASDAIAIPDLAAPTANSYRFWGCGTTPATPTTTTPITDGIGFELSTAGKMFAVVYAGGTRTAIQDLSTSGNSSQPTDANSHRYICYIRTDKAYWYIDGITSAQLVATSNFQSPQVQTLPRLFLAVGGPTPPGSNAQITCTGATAWDTGKNAVQIGDGTFPWRKATVSATGGLSVSSSSLTGTTVPSGAFYIGGNIGGNLTGINAIGDTADAITGQTTLVTSADMKVYNGTSWDRVRSGSNGDISSRTGTVATMLYGSNGANANMVAVVADNADNVGGNGARALEVASIGLLYGGTGNSDRARANTSAALIAAGTTSTQTGITFTTYNANSLLLIVNVTANGGTLTVAVNGTTASGYSTNLLTSTALAGTGVTALRIFPGATPSPNLVANDRIPRTISVTATLSLTGTYGIDYALGTA